MNLAESLLHGLKSYGVSEIFGIPGDFALPPLIPRRAG
jgi:indolepyruvate decarboxylase